MKDDLVAVNPDMSFWAQRTMFVRSESMIITKGREYGMKNSFPYVRLLFLKFLWRYNFSYCLKLMLAYWPFTLIRNRSLLPVATRKIIQHISSLSLRQTGHKIHPSSSRKQQKRSRLDSQCTPIQDNTLTKFID